MEKNKITNNFWKHKNIAIKSSSTALKDVQLPIELAFCF